MQQESHNIIIFNVIFTKHISPKNFILTLDSLIEYLINIKNKYFFINK
jgi:hypothetical protein